MKKKERIKEQKCEKIVPAAKTIVALASKSSTH